MSGQHVSHMYHVSWGCLLAVNVQVYLETSQNYQCEKLGNSNDVKSFAIGSDLWRVSLLKEQMMTTVKENMLKMLV